jgi:peptide/nickel transport system substrate-binding protein
VARALAAALLAGLVAVSAGAATPKRGGAVRFAPFGPAISCLNPFACDTGGGFGGGVLSQVLEGAYELGPHGLGLRPDLVSRVTVGRNPFSLTYRIRSQARWNDGVAVSSADFRFTYRTYATHGDAGVREFYGKIRRFQTLDAKTFRIVLREPVGGWRELFDAVLPQHALAGEDLTKVWRERVDNPDTGRPIGNGPFLVSRLESGRQLTLIRNPNYWGRHTAYLDRFIHRFNVFDAADPLGPLRRNEIDVAELIGPLLIGRAPDVRRLPGWRVVTWPDLADEHLTFRVGRGGHPALKNRLVRRALAYGIDRVQIARRINPELGGRARPLDSTAFLPGASSYRPNWSVYRYDPARARRLLEQAGCRRGADRIYSCAGERLRLRFFTAAGQTRREKTLQLIKAQLQQVGVDVLTFYVPRPAFLSQVLPGGDFDAALFSWNTLSGGSAVPEAICGDIQNYAGYCTRLTMRDVQQVDRIVDPAVRSRLLNAVDRKLARDVPLLPLYQPVLEVALKKTIRGLDPGGAGGPVARNEDWWLER